MRPHTLDPTAGERARNIQQHPEVPQHLEDPTDRRCGEFVPRATEHASGPGVIVDPTDPACGDPRH